MFPPDLISELVHVGIKLRLADGDQLQVTAPRGQLSADLRHRIALHKSELIAWLAGIQSGQAGLPAIVPDADAWGEPFPLSDLQTSFLVGSGEGLEFHVRPHQYMEFDFDGLDPARFGRALNQALDRQRANIVIVRDDMRLETVAEMSPLPVPVYDLRGLTERKARSGLDRIRTSMERTELPLDRWPWLEACISRHGRQGTRLHFNNNNFFSDALGTSRLLEAAMHFYDHPETPLPELAVSYRDCVAALAAIEESALGQASRKYWCERMADWPEPPAIPLVPGIDTRIRSRLERRELVIDDVVWSAVKKRARGLGLTPSTVLLSAYAEVIAYWSGSRHFLLSNMMTHRLPLHPQVTDVLGNFASLYPLEVDWRSAEPFASRAHRLQARLAADMDHMYWSGTRVLQALNQLRRTPGRAACPFATGSALFAGQFRRPGYSLLETPQVLLDCEFWEQPDDSLWVVLDVIEAMFPEGLIDSIQAGFRQMIGQLADSGAWESRSFDLLPAAQRSRFARLNRPSGPVPSGLLHGCLPVRAAQDPDRPCVVTERETLSRADLNRRSARIAARLSAAGAGQGDLVAVVLPKGWEQVAAVFGTLGAGAAYVPVDPTWPAERIQYLLRDTSAAAVVTLARFSDDLAGLSAAPVLAVDEAAEEGEPAGVLPVAGTADGLAYVIYTSGSTGLPKGAMLSHSGPLNTITDINRKLEITDHDVILGLSSLCFDLSVYDIFGAVAAGATLVLPSVARSDPAAWAELVAVHGVTVWNSVPAVMELFVAEASASGRRFPSLRTVMLSGDWIPVGLPGRIREVAPNARVISLGGATEASIWSIWFPVDHPDPQWVSIPYGKPLANQTWHVLDDQGRQVPTWVTGELYIGGAGVALGYLGDPAKTEASFVRDAASGERRYRTGDLGRRLPSGDIEFLGRADFQIKVQGFRVEPGEIEHALLDHPAVGQAVVAARPAGSGKQLAAFVTPRQPQDEPDPGVLRAFLTERLPGYMIPARIAVLDRLPLTANGKVDRRALEKAAPAEPQAERAHVAPRTPTEAALTGIWEEILSTAPIGTGDDFFELGGQSFAALRVATLLAQRLGRRVSLGTLLEHRTIAELASWLDNDAAPWSPLVRLRDSGSADGEPLFLVHPAGGNVLCYQGLAGLLDRPCFGFQAPGPAVGRDPLERVADLASEYVSALRQVRPHGPYLVGGWSSGAVIAFELARQLEQLGETVRRVVVIDAPAPVAPRRVDEGKVLLWFLQDLDVGFDPAHVDVATTQALLALPEHERLDAALALVEGLGLAGHPLDPASMASTLAVFRGVTRACNRYRAPVIAADITVVRARQGIVAEFCDNPLAFLPDWGWGALTTGSVNAVHVGGTHYSLLKHPQLAHVAAAIADQMRPSPDRQAGPAEGSR